MARSWLIFSGKGGTGKSLICAALGKALAEGGHSVCLWDGDTGLRSLDLLLGLQDQVVTDAGDVLSGRCQPREALLSPAGCDGLRLLPASQSMGNTPNPAALQKLSGALKQLADCVLLDAPAGLGEGVRRLLPAADESLLVLTPEETALRDGEAALSFLEKEKRPRPYLLINRYSPRARLTPAQMVARLDIPLLGCIPEDENLPGALLDSEKLSTREEPGCRAICRVAGRFLGETIPMPDFTDSRLWKGGTFHR